MSRRRGWDIHQVVCPEYFTKYYQNIYDVDWGDQFQEHGAGFYSKEKFEKWYKHGHLGLCDFGLLNSHIDWNMSCERIVVHGVKMHDHLNKWKFSDIIAEESKNFTAVVDSDNMIDLKYAMPSILEK